MMRSFFLNWQDPDTQRWLPVAKLVNQRGYFVFGYTRGAQVSKNFLPFGRMNDVSSLYISDELFPIFANRVMNEKRPEYARYARWSGLDRESDPLRLMARIGGVRATDALQVSPVPEKSRDGRYRSVFFVHGISHLAPDSADRVAALEPGEVLFPMLDIQNPYDGNAVCLRTRDPAVIIGYCPRFVAPDLRYLCESAETATRLKVLQVNQDAPSQFKLLCEAVSTWPEHFVPCSTDEHQLISNLSVEDALKTVSTAKPFQRAVG
ncbi:HIRAN domain-containing protein [Rhizobium sp. S95]|uniref:HIRAN domain-containing protein n=1 Tax=Ciceribacter sichuanensis TaxID=2949647 RepID=A0AAJ1F8D2_9HYPH|nr:MULTISPECIES: HIRAN domain-containing protein [unclassified Ciceribacter]MCM2395767.1 HIRAN domain-containing protein [Ciceribacter sp. S95]MCO5958882.1 HIRAN domain-containing protein [Ciceribacter sp. S101]